MAFNTAFGCSVPFRQDPRMFQAIKSLRKPLLVFFSIFFFLLKESKRMWCMMWKEARPFSLIVPLVRRDNYRGSHRYVKNRTSIRVFSRFS